MMNILATIDQALVVIENKGGLLDLGLPKWPQMLTIGNSVTVEQAKEIIRRTDNFFSYPSDWRGNDRRYNRRVIKTLDIPTVSYDLKGGAFGEAYERQERWMKAWGFIQTHYVHNDWISCSFIGGPHGWCHPDGQIFFADNIGKWPSVEEVTSDWTTLAQTFPFIDLVSILMSGEECEEEIKPVVGFRVKDGAVNLFDPTKMTIPNINRDLDEMLMKGPCGVGLSAEHGLPWSWIEEWSKYRPTEQQLAIEGLIQ